MQIRFQTCWTEVITDHYCPQGLHWKSFKCWFKKKSAQLKVIGHWIQIELTNWGEDQVLESLDRSNPNERYCKYCILIKKTQQFDFKLAATRFKLTCWLSSCSGFSICWTAVGLIANLSMAMKDFVYMFQHCCLKIRCFDVICQWIWIQQSCRSTCIFTLF